MKHIISIIIFFCIFVYLSAIISSSPNYVLVKYSQGTGNQGDGETPQSSNYILSGCDIGSVSSNPVTCPSYVLYPGYLHPESIEILPPENVQIYVVEDQVIIEWDEVPGASVYRIYSSDDPESGFTLDLPGEFSGNSWSTSVVEAKKFYYITAE